MTCLCKSSLCLKEESAGGADMRYQKTTSNSTSAWSVSHSHGGDDTFQSPSVFNIEPGTLPPGLRNVPKITIDSPPQSEKRGGPGRRHGGSRI